MGKVFFITGIILLSFNSVFAQDQQDTSLDLLKEISAPDSAKQKLLPDHYLFTQHFLWGEHGLMRKFDRFELTPEKRQEELNLRRNMLSIHQYLGIATLGGMIAQGIVGQKLYNGQRNLADTHETLASAVNLAYFSTASLALFAPPKMTEDTEGYSSIKVHKVLAIVHFTSMIATNVLAGMLESDKSLRPWHRAAAFTAFGSLAASLFIIKF